MKQLTVERIAAIMFITLLVFAKMIAPDNNFDPKHEYQYQEVIDTDRPIEKNTLTLPTATEGLPAHKPRIFGEAVRFVAEEICDEQDNCRLESVALHEYENYTVDELRVIAEYDGEAAIVLADKLAGGDWEEAKNWALRAFIMTKDPYAYDMALNYARVMPGEGFVNGEFDRKSAERAYVWLKTAHMLGVSDGTELTEQEIILDRHGINGRNRLDNESAKAAAYLKNKRLEIVGEGF